MKKQEVKERIFGLITGGIVSYFLFGGDKLLFLAILGAILAPTFFKLRRPYKNP